MFHGAAPAFSMEDHGARIKSFISDRASGRKAWRGGGARDARVTKVLLHFLNVQHGIVAVRLRTGRRPSSRGQHEQATKDGSNKALLTSRPTERRTERRTRTRTALAPEILAEWMNEYFPSSRSIQRRGAASASDASDRETERLPLFRRPQRQDDPL